MTDRERDELLIDTARAVTQLLMMGGAYTTPNTLGRNWSAVGPAYRDRLNYLKSLKASLPPTQEVKHE